MDNNMAVQFGERLKSLRTKKDLSMESIADYAGIARSTYAGYETQNRFAPIDRMAKIATMLGTSTDYLIGLTDIEEPKDITKDINDFLTYSDLHWKGIPLSNEEIHAITNLFEIMMRERSKNVDTREDAATVELNEYKSFRAIS